MLCLRQCYRQLNATIVKLRYKFDRKMLTAILFDLFFSLNITTYCLQWTHKLLISEIMYRQILGKDSNLEFGRPDFRKCDLEFLES